MINRFASIICFALAALLAVALAFAVLDWFLPSAVSVKDRAGIIQGVVTALAIIFGGLLAAVKLELFRDFEPHLTITHTVVHRPLGNGYVHIAVKAVLRNSSRVVVKLRDGRFLLQHITAPAPAGNVLYPQWPVLDEGSLDLGDHEISIEPGQTIQEVLQFIVPGSITTVLIDYFFHDPRFPDDPLRGWGMTDVYDMI